MSVTIRTTNDAHGDPIEITAATLEEAVALLQDGLRTCGPEFTDVTITCDDYEIVSS